MVVVDRLGVVKDGTPVPPVNGDPPVALAYQSMVDPAWVVADNVSVPVPQLEAPVTEATVGFVLTVTSEVLALAVHPNELVAVTV
jgi:hypothetical protein